MNKERFIKILAECCRILTGATFVFSGIVKAIDPVGGAIKIGDYLTAFGLNSLSWMENILSFNLAAIEFTLGICMLLAVYRGLTTFCMLLMMCLMTPLTLYLAIFNPVSDCGCFGDAIVISNWATFFKNVPLLAASIIAYCYHKHLTPCYTYKAYWFVVLFSYFFCMAFCYQNFTHLPITDFLPYKVGLNIPKLMEIPDDAPQDEFVFIYEKEGVKKEFKVEEIPYDDVSWTYVSQKLVREGFMPVINSFELYNKNEDNIAEAVLSYPQLTFLLVIPKIKGASDYHIDIINNVYDHAVEAKLPFYGVTASSEEEIDEWKEKTGADYPFLTADETMLKSIVRSNPGLVAIKNGTILAKWHHNDIQGEEKLAEVIEKLENTPIDEDNLTAPEMIAEQKKKEQLSWLRKFTGFTLPLLLIWVYDFFRNRQVRKRRIVTNL